MVLKSWEISSLFFQRSESVSSLRGRFNLLTYATPDEASFLQPTQYTEDWTYSLSPSSLWRQSKHMVFTSTAKTVSIMTGTAVVLPMHAFSPREWPENGSLRHFQGDRLCRIVQDFKGGGGWWQTRSIRCFWVIKTLIEANTSTFRPKQGQRVTEGLIWALRWFIINEKISISSHFISFYTGSNWSH